METDRGNAADRLDFRNAWARGALRSIWAFFAGRRTDLASWDEIREKLRPTDQTSRGTQTVPISKIVGSVGRYQDFDDAFLPRSSHLTDRWARVNRAFNADVHLPPVKLYKVGEVYFVIDGNHRVSVARQHGVEFIDADIVEARLRIALTEADVDARNFDLLAEASRFMEHTRLNELRPHADIRFTIAGGCERLLDHIDKHRYFLGLDHKRDIGYAEAVASWYDTVYLPLVDVIRKEDVLAKFPNRTEGDLYLWVSEHRWYLQEEDAAGDVPAAEATQHFAEHFEPPSTLERIVARVGEAISDAADALFPNGNAQDGLAAPPGTDALADTLRPKASPPRDA